MIPPVAACWPHGEGSLELCLNPTSRITAQAQRLGLDCLALTGHDVHIRGAVAQHDPQSVQHLHHITRHRIEGGHSISQISAAVQVEQPAVTKTMAKFQNMGLIEIEPHPSDKRSKLVRARPTADTLVGTIDKDMGSDLFTVFQNLDGSDIEAFASQLKTLGQWLDKNRL